MSNYDEVLTHLPQDESNAMTSAQLFNLCKGFDASKDVSTALSQLYKAGKIFRKVSSNEAAAIYIYTGISHKQTRCQNHRHLRWLIA